MKTQIEFFRQKAETFLLNVRKMWMVNKNYSFFRNRLFNQNLPEDLQNAAFTKPLKTEEKNPRVFAQYPKMTKKTMFYKIDILNKSFYGLVEYIFTTLPIFSLTQTKILHSFSKKDKKLDFTKTIIFNKIFLCTRWNKKRQTSKKIVNRKPRTFCTMSEKDRKLIVFLKHQFFLKLLLWTRSISF